MLAQEDLKQISQKGITENQLKHSYLIFKRVSRF
jgi:hypothetical protein